MTLIPYPNELAAIARSTELWEQVRGTGWREGNVTVRLYGTCIRTGDPESDVGLPDGVDAAMVVSEADHWLDTLIRADAMTADELGVLVALYPEWVNGTTYVIGDLRAYAGTLYRCVQAHMSQADWTPDVVPALFARMTPENVIPEWVQPTGAQDAYALDALATHNGRVWKSLMNANAYEPGVIGSWRDQSDPPLWVAPVGAIGLWQIGNVAFYNGATWRCTAANNTYAPGVYGWVRV